MITIVIGQSGSGKTTYVKNNYLNNPFEIVEDIIPITVSNNIIAIGKYGINKRCEGTDTLSYNSIEKIIEQIEKLTKDGKNIVVEGDRINNRRMFEWLKQYTKDVELVLVTCSIKTSMSRLRKAGSTITPTFVKTTKTKAKNNYLNYGKYFKTKVVNTDENTNC